jgi:hypothetical protein
MIVVNAGQAQEIASQWSPPSDGQGIRFSHHKTKDGPAPQWSTVERWEHRSRIAIMFNTSSRNGARRRTAEAPGQ